MRELAKLPTNVDEGLRAIRRYLLKKDNAFDRGPSYEGNGDTLPSVKLTMCLYESLGYRKLIEIGNPPVYAVFRRGHREIHIFQLSDPEIRKWLEDDKVSLNDPKIRAYFMEKSGSQESDMVSNGKPRNFHFNEIDHVFIATTDDL